MMCALENVYDLETSSMNRPSTNEKCASYAPKDAPNLSCIESNGEKLVRKKWEKVYSPRY